MAKRKIVLFGAGNNGKAALRFIKAFPEIYCDELAAVVDNDKGKWGNKLLGITIESPSIIKELQTELVVISSNYEKNIREQLICEMNIPKERIIGFADYQGVMYSAEKYNRRYKGKESNNNSFRTDKIVIYTALIGNYDRLNEPQFTNDNVSYVCFTDDRSLKSNVWNMEYIDNDGTDNTRLARKIKLHPHLFFKDFETSVWVDGKFEISGDIRSYIAKYGRKEPMLCFPHFDRECIYDEGGKCIFFGFGDKRQIVDQMSAYRAEGYPFDNGLYETGCIVRRHNDDRVIRIMEQWMDEINRFSNRDQLSLPVVCYRNSFMPDISAENCFYNEWLRHVGHIVWRGR